MRTFEVRIMVQIPTTELPVDREVDDDFLTTVFNAAMRRIETRGVYAVDIVEKRVGEKDVVLF
jgi:hypothetical protein